MTKWKTLGAILPHSLLPSLEKEAWRFQNLGPRPLLSLWLLKLGCSTIKARRFSQKDKKPINSRETVLRVVPAAREAWEPVDFGVRMWPEWPLQTNHRSSQGGQSHSSARTLKKGAKANVLLIFFYGHFFYLMPVSGNSFDQVLKKPGS